MKLRVVAACGVGLAVLSFTFAPQQAQARPQYLKQFGTKYEKLDAKTKEVKCGVCHYGDTKKNNNDYGDALKKALEDKNVKDEKKITDALGKIEKEPSKVPKEPGGKDMKTFGELINEGTLPGTEPEKK